MKKHIFSGVQPSGVVHLGNYLGAIKRWVDLQIDYDCTYCVVDLHAITMPQDPHELARNTYRIAATYLAAGIDPKRSTIFVQSHRPEHAELMWLLNTITYMGEMRRMTQFKDKTGSLGEGDVPLGLFNYPVLMAADILLYQTDVVPVGEDQKQHVELARNLAQRFNRKFGETFHIPEPLIAASGARVMGLDDPSKKMSKSAVSANNYIALTDDADTIGRKISRAVTDSGSEVKSGPDKPAITNLLGIFSQLAGVSVSDLEKRYDGKNYAVFKKDLADLIVAKIVPVGRRTLELEKDTKTLDRVLFHGAEKLRHMAQETLKSARQKMGLI